MSYGSGDDAASTSPIRTPGRVRRWLRRYLPAEVAGAAAAVAAVVAAHHLGSSGHISALGSSVAETAGFYATFLVRDTVRSKTVARTGLARAVGSAVRGMAVEFGPAEAVDTAAARPLLMYAGVALTGNVLVGTIVGKLAADVVFYTIVVPCHALRSRLFQGRTQVTAR